MPVICEFYPGMNPVVFRQTRIGELDALVRHMNHVQKKRNQNRR